jgi:hypothetical protein
VVQELLWAPIFPWSHLIRSLVSTLLSRDSLQMEIRRMAPVDGKYVLVFYLAG